MSTPRRGNQGNGRDERRQAASPYSRSITTTNSTNSNQNTPVSFCLDICLLWSVQTNAQSTF